MSASLARALRTLLQGLLAALGTISLATIFNGLDPGVVGALQIMLTALVSQAQNALENSGHIPAILKATIHDAPPKAVTNVIPVAPPDV